MVHIECRVADTRREIDDALRVRWAVFGGEMGLLAAPPPAPREVDAFDLLDTTIHFVAYAEGRPVGAARLLLPNPEVAHARGGGLGLDLEGRFDLEDLGREGRGIAEATRFCVLEAFRCTGAAFALDEAMRRESRRRGITRWIAAANTETDALEDAWIIHRVAERRGLISRRFRVAPLPGEEPPAIPRAPFYTPEQRARARGGELRGLGMPRALAVFAGGMGARFTGAPRYDARFRRFALPLVAAVDREETTARPGSRDRLVSATA